MNYETKRNVFKTIADKCTGYDYELYNQYLNQYDDALPDDLPLIPKAVGVHIRWCKSNAGIKAGISNLLDALELPDWAGLEAEYWINDNPEMFARAWLLGIWRIEETGEIVKLEDGE